MFITADKGKSSGVAPDPKPGGFRRAERAAPSISFYRVAGDRAAFPTNHSYVRCSPSERETWGDQPVARSALESSSFCGVPLGRDVSHLIGPSYPTVSRTFSAS